MADVITEREADDLMDRNGHYLRIGSTIAVYRAIIGHIGKDGVAYISLTELARETGESRVSVQRRIRALRSTNAPYIRIAKAGLGRTHRQGYRIVRRTLNGNADDQPNLWRKPHKSGAKMVSGGIQYANPVAIYLPQPLRINAGISPVVVPPADWRCLRSWPACHAIRGFGFSQILDWHKCAIADLETAIPEMVAEGERLAAKGIPCAILHKPCGEAALFRYAQPGMALLRQLGRINSELKRCREEMRRNGLVDPIVGTAAHYNTAPPAPRAPSCDNTEGP